ncbi:MAG: hypothetical protein HYY06_05220 [Deltaproteobacteria bacterium]|nr:hypothetical protein [Deltaproteobacteria bacterium]
MASLPTRPLTVLALALAACNELVAVGPERLPPDAPEVIDEGTLYEVTPDNCYALEVGTPIRITASPTSSVGVEMATARLADLGFVALAWLEVDEDGLAQQAAARYLLDDGVQYGGIFTQAVAQPASIAVFPVPTLLGFAVATADAEGLRVSLTTLGKLGVDRAEYESSVVEGLSSPRGVAVDDHMWIAALDEDGEVVLLDLARRADGYALEATRHDTSIRADSAEIAADSQGALLVFLDEGQAGSARIARDGSIETESFSIDAGLTSRLRAATTGDRIVVPVVPGGEQGFVYNPDPAGWFPVGEFPHDQSSDPRAPGIAIEDGGARWAIVRVTGGDDTPADVELLRGGLSLTIGSACSSATECSRVTTDLAPSAEPAIVSLPDGYAVAWSDAVDGQLEVFYARLTCLAAADTQ